MDGAADGSALRLLLHCYRCQAMYKWAGNVAEDAEKTLCEEPGASKLLLSRAELQLAQGGGSAAEPAEAQRRFRKLDLPGYEGLALLVRARQELAQGVLGAPAAVEWASDAVEAFQVDGHSHGLGRALLLLAEAQWALQDPKADHTVAKALEVFKWCGDERWQAHTLQQMAVWSWKDLPHLAVQHAEAALFLWKKHSCSLLREAQLAEVLCAAYLRLQEPEVALRSVRSCLNRAREAGDRNIEGHMMYAAISANQALQGLEAACQAADTAAMIFQDVGNRNMELAVLLAKCEAQLGSSAKDALDTAKQAVALVQEAGMEKEEAAGLAWAQLAAVQTAQEEFNAARKGMQAAIEAFQSAGQRSRVARAKMQQAEIFVRMKDMTLAGPVILEARRIYQDLGDLKGEASALMMLSRVQLARDPKKAMRAAEWASELYRQTGDQVSWADALILLSQAALAGVSQGHFAPELLPALQAAQDALAIAKHLEEHLLAAYAHLALARVQVVARPLLKEAWQNSVQACELFSLASSASGLGCGLEVQAIALHHLEYKREAAEAWQKAKEAYRQAGDQESAARCDQTLHEMGASKAATQAPAPEEQLMQLEPLMPLALKEPKRERKEIQDLSLLHGEDLVMAQLTKIMQDLGVDDIEMDEGLMSAGMTSRAAVQLRSEMEQTFGNLRIPGTLAFDHPSIRSIAGWMAENTDLVAG
ncbi:unnamed protein product [Effrenium voratum]|uniref:Carrier domain-containing protein n=1 Tax=Effrenium voratum TaxID=2562239 RepID=A0AA36IXQ2_9DINO|nr:unnamed protein product [Effrenium voratum]